MSADQSRVSPLVCFGGNLFVLPPHNWPKLPASEPCSVSKVKNGVDVVVGDDVSLSGPDVERHHDESDLITKQPVLQRSIDWEQRGVVQLFDGRTLLKVEREQCEAVNIRLALRLPARKIEDLKDVKPVFRSEPVETHDWIDK